MRYLDAPRHDPTATAVLRRLSDQQRELPRLPSLKRRHRKPLMATVAECITAKVSATPPPLR